MKERPIIFLDVDGVLNGHNFDDVEDIQSNSIDPECVEHFNRVLWATDARIVLSSAWRYMILGGAMTLDGFEYLLRTHRIAAKGRLIGTTVADEVIEGRGGQIRHWLNREGNGCRYVVIDDGGATTLEGIWSDLGIVAAGHPVVWTKGNTGLTEADADRAIGLLLAAAAGVGDEELEAMRASTGRDV
jgi:hypothetical protein